MEVVLVDVSYEGFVARRQASRLVRELGIEIVKGTLGFLLIDKEN